MTLIFQFIFYLFGLIAIASAALFVTRKNPVSAALWLVNVMISLAAMYIMLGAQFVGVVQVIIYAGAIMVVFLFVVMLLNLGRVDDITDIGSIRTRMLAGLLGLLMLVPLVMVARPGDRLLGGMLPVRPELAPAPGPGADVVSPIAEVFFRDQLLAFEASSILLLTAIIGAVVLAKRSERR